MGLVDGSAMSENKRDYATTIDGERREITTREAVVTQLVNKSAAAADLRATKMLVDMLKDAEKKAGVAPPPSPPRSSRPMRKSWRPSSPGCANPGSRSCGSLAAGIGVVRPPPSRGRLFEASPCPEEPPQAASRRGAAPQDQEFFFLPSTT
jgi:hypothetical protein